MTLHDLERMFQRGALTRRQFVRGLVALGLTASAIDRLAGVGSARLAQAQSAAAQYLVILVLDAFRPDYMQLAPMPALQDLVRNGTLYDRAWVGQLESETPVGHASLSTGAWPKHNGIIGFEWRDPSTHQEVLDGWPPAVLAGHLERDLKASGTSSIPTAVKAARPDTKVVALSSEKIYAADAMGGPAADYIMHYKPNQRKTAMVPAALVGHEPPPGFLQQSQLQSALPMKHFTDWDYLSGILAVAAFATFRPGVLMVNFPGADVYGHPYGGPASPHLFAQIAAGVDRNIARIVQAYKQAGVYDQTLFVVTADHGMVPNDRTVDGVATKAAVAQGGGQYLFHTGGTAADIYLRNYWHARSVAQTMARVPGVSAAYYRTDPHGQPAYLRAPGTQIDSGLDAAYQYLLGTFSGATSPDVVAPFRENTVGTASNSAHGDHGGLNWGAQHIPLILSGPGVRQGVVSHAPARLVDVAPTVLRLLNAAVPAMDGVVLADAILQPAAQDVAAQAGQNTTLTPYQDALIAQATADTQEDAKLHHTPPPAAAPHP